MGHENMAHYLKFKKKIGPQEIKLLDYNKVKVDLWMMFNFYDVSFSIQATVSSMC